jgi:hypothetical protein
MRGVAASAVALCVVLFGGTSWASPPPPVSSQIADYNAAKVALTSGALTVPPDLATYNVTTTALAIGSSFVVTLPAGFTFASTPSLTNTGTSTFTLTSGGMGSQTATFTVATAALAVGQSLSLAGFNVQGATALETPIPVANALGITLQAIGTDAAPILVPAFASEPGALALYVGAIQFIDTAPPSVGTLFLGPPDTPLVVLNAFAIQAETVDAATQTVPVLNPDGTANTLAPTDTAVITLTGLFAGVGATFASSDPGCSHPIAPGTFTATNITFSGVPFNAEVFGCAVANGTTQLQQNPNGLSPTLAPGSSVDFQGGPIIPPFDEFAGIIVFAGPPLPEVAFSPSVIPPDGATPSLMTVTVTNPSFGGIIFNNPPLTGVAFSDTLPAGIQSVGVASDTCGGSGSSNATGFSKSGVSLAAGASCAVQLNVIAPLGTAVGPYVDSTSTVTSNQDSPGGPTSATLTVTTDPIFTLSVSESGNGAGQVTSAPSGINCSATSNQCAAGFASGTSVTLSALPGAFASFTGWSGGGCSGTGSCVVTVNQAQGVAASFAQVNFTLSVTESGDGTGLVTSSPLGIVCSSIVNQCGASYAGGSTVTLNASAGTGSSFTGWHGGGCSGTESCAVTMSQAQSVTARFEQIPSFTLSVALSGGGTGTVSSNPSGIFCGTACSASFATGTKIALTATPAAGSTFAGWSGGGCSGTGGCTVTLSAAKAVSATFTGTGTSLLAAVLPDARSVEVGATATAFAYLINTGTGAGAPCSITPNTSVPATFLYQTTDQGTNTVTGSPNTPVAIAPGGTQSFLIAFTPSAAFNTTAIPFNFECGGLDPAPVVAGVNNFTLSASTTPVPDIVAIAASADPGYVDIPGATGTGAFAVATINLGVDATITAAANTGAANLPVAVLLCQTNPTSGACLAAPTPTLTTDIQPDATPTFGVFVTGNVAVADMPAVNRVFVTFTDAGGMLRGETSVAVRTQ